MLTTVMTVTHQLIHTVLDGPAMAGITPSVIVSGEVCVVPEEALEWPLLGGHSGQGFLTTSRNVSKYFDNWYSHTLHPG